MAMGQRFVSDVLSLMRQIINRQNANDPDSSDTKLLQYLNDFVSLTMSDDVKLWEQFGTMTFVIDGSHPDGVYTFNDVGADSDFVNISSEAFISFLDPVGHSVSWNWLPIYLDPGEFYTIWGINNEDILIQGYPTMMLYYGNQFVFRTIPDREFQIRIYGYKKNNNYTGSDNAIQYDYWLRYLAYGASNNYSMDYNLEESTQASITRGYSRERKLMLTHTHNTIKQSRPMPNF